MLSIVEETTPITYVMSAIRCASDHPMTAACAYRIEWSINPHMEVGSVNFARAEAQHARLRDTLRDAGAEVVEMPFIHGAYDSVFAKDPAMLVRSEGRLVALLASQRHPERRTEQAPRRAQLQAYGYDVREAPDAIWEGGDVVVLPFRRGIFLGSGQRSDPRAATWMAEQTGLPVFPLELVDPYLFHLDMAMAALPDGSVLVCEDVLAPHSRELVREVLGADVVISVPREDALAFGLNLVTVNNTVIVGAQIDRVIGTLEDLGFDVVVSPLSEFQLAGGSAACLANRVHPVRAAQRDRSGPRLRVDAEITLVSAGNVARQALRTT